MDADQPPTELLPGTTVGSDKVTVIAAKPSRDQFIVLGIWRQPTWWATWIYDPAEDCLWRGRYWWSFDEAVADYQGRA